MKKINPTWEKSNIQLFMNDCFNIFPQIEDHSLDMILTDLPYGTTACSWDSVLPLDKLWEEYKRVIKKNGAIVLTAAQPFTWRLCASNPEWFKYEIIWEKPNGTNPMLVKKQPFRTHENILVFYQKQPTYNPQMTFGHSNYSEFSDNTKFIGEAYNGDEKKLISKHKKNTDGSRYPRSVQKFAQDRSGHPTKKPVELMRWLIKTYTNVGDIILDNTMGEGTTGVACVQEQRKFIGIELNKKYFNTSVENINCLIKGKGDKMKKKDFQSIRQVMKPKVPLKQLKFDSHDLNKAIKEVIERKMKERIEAGLKKAIEEKNAGN